jgi:hypothetical protein
MAESARDLLRRRLIIYSNPTELPDRPATQTDRRVADSDRRRYHTFLAHDRRSGIADRRRRLPSIPALVDLNAT